LIQKAAHIERNEKGSPLNALPSYSAAVGEYIFADPKVLETMERKVDELNPSLRELSLKIHGGYIFQL